MFSIEWINLDEFGSLVVLIVLLLYMGRQITSDQLVRLWSNVVGVVAFILYCIAGIQAAGEPSATDLMYIGIRAALGSGIMLGLARILIALGVLIYRQIPKTPPVVKPEPLPPSRPLEEEKPPPPPPPPPPTPEQKAEKALEDFEKRLDVVEKAKLDETEKKAGRKKVKQKYVKDIDDAIK